MPENWTYQYLNILVHQGRRHRVTLQSITGAEAIEWLLANNIKYDITYDPDTEFATFYFEKEKDAFLFKLRWLGA